MNLKSTQCFSGTFIETHTSQCIEPESELESI